MKNGWVLALVLCLFAQISAPRRADAIVGAFITSAPVVLTGAVLMGGGGLLGLVNDVKHPNNGGRGWIPNVAGVSLVLGFILLDTPAGAAGRFAALTEAQAEVVGLSEAEMHAFNAHLDELNASAETVGRALERLPRPTAEASYELWRMVTPELDANAAAGAAKVAEAALRNLNP